MKVFLIERIKVKCDEIDVIAVLAETAEEARRLAYEDVNEEGDELLAREFLAANKSNCSEVDQDRKGVFMLSFH